MLPLTELIPEPLHRAPQIVSLNPPWSQSLIQVSLCLPHSKFDNVSLFPIHFLCISELIKAVLRLNVSLRPHLNNHVSSSAIPPLLTLVCATFIILPVFFQINNLFGCIALLLWQLRRQLVTRLLYAVEKTKVGNTLPYLQWQGDWDTEYRLNFSVLLLLLGRDYHLPLTASPVLLRQGHSLTKP